MTRLDIFAAWVAFGLAFAVTALATLQATGYGPLTNDQAMPIIALGGWASNLFEQWVKKAQDLYDNIKLLRKT